MVAALQTIAHFAGGSPCRRRNKGKRLSQLRRAILTARCSSMWRARWVLQFMRLRSLSRDARPGFERTWWVRYWKCGSSRRFLLRH